MVDVADLPLFEGATISQSNFKGAFLSLMQRHNLSSKATDSILRLIKLTLQKGNNCPSSTYKLDESLKDIGYNYVKHITCCSCQRPLENDVCIDDNCCQHGTYSVGDASSIFYVIQLEQELKRLISGEACNTM